MSFASFASFASLHGLHTHLDRARALVGRAGEAGEADEIARFRIGAHDEPRKLPRLGGIRATLGPKPRKAADDAVAPQILSVEAGGVDAVELRLLALRRLLDDVGDLLGRRLVGIEVDGSSVARSALLTVDRDVLPAEAEMPRDR